MRLFAFAFALVVCPLPFGGTAYAEEKFDPEKLVGKWSPDEIPADTDSVVVEFKKDGKMSLTVVSGGKKDMLTGTYKLKGDRLTTTLGGEERETEVLKLSSGALVMKTNKGTITVLIRHKEK